MDKLLKRKGVDSHQVKGVGIAIAGLVNKRNGFVDFSPDESIHIVPATSGENASLIGAFSLISNKILNF